jgi:16S rRNA A1518/A1519 N6-dimethyltransferase RsmA/KsgA/DIM1 with predicted DNA glycosylase/AP lyase activity
MSKDITGVCSNKVKGLNQFYTTPKNATLCAQLYNKFKSVNKEQDLIIEPSAGCGSFIKSLYKLCNNVILIDIDPKHERIKKGDFLNFYRNPDKFKKVHLIGNPPFSHVNQFIKHACKFSDAIGFILTLSFRKESRKKTYPLNFHLIHEYVLLNNNLSFNGGTRKVPTVFQI